MSEPWVKLTIKNQVKNHALISDPTVQEWLKKCEDRLNQLLPPYSTVLEWLLVYGPEQTQELVNEYVMKNAQIPPTP